MNKRILIIHLPVIYAGYLKVLEEYGIGEVYILDDAFVQELGGGRGDIASLPASKVQELLSQMGFSDVAVLSQDLVKELKGAQFTLVQDEVSRRLYEQYLEGEKVEWISVFLRWDESSVQADELEDDTDLPTTKDAEHLSFMEEAYKEAEKSGDWWRQVGAVVVKDGKIVLRSHNAGVPDEHTPYQRGAVRDFIKTGEQPERANYIHAEQAAVAEAAQQGVSLKGSSLYVTHFPCPVCSKLIARSGVKELYVSEGSSVLDGKSVMEGAGVKITYIKR